jgi:hypothetical protein
MSAAEVSFSTAIQRQRLLRQPTHRVVFLIVIVWMQVHLPARLVRLIPGRRIVQDNVRPLQSPHPFFYLAT